MSLTFYPESHGTGHPRSNLIPGASAGEGGVIEAVDRQQAHVPDEHGADGTEEVTSRIGPVVGKLALEHDRIPKTLVVTQPLQFAEGMALHMAGQLDVGGVPEHPSPLWKLLHEGGWC
ncbi:hypothetical protein TNIN_281161 [Trichonephila inaurata madagascariensis]|uniref:Uncharacterized protein n=1 Tax=Trichonephila inaurata madagascariensis TaxID=2747483 RepID=A0A8X6YLT2_9ARAC|nr:hypothetical protein TNIN_281161 [Trichonephila inaurata madagascariensis]